MFIDWERDSAILAEIRGEILRSEHELSFDPISEIEFLASRHRDRDVRLAFASIATISQRLDITTNAAELAASWLARMDQAQRRSRFADAIIAAVAHEAGATLLTSDRGIAQSFPISVREY